MSDALDDIVSSMVESEPSVNEKSVDAIQAAMAEEKTDDVPSQDRANMGVDNPANSGSAAVSSGDSVFDPAIHSVDANGQPKRKKDGTYKRKPGRRSGNKSNVSPVGTVTTDYSKLSEFVCGIAFGGFVATLGTHFEPTQQERSSIETATARYLESQDITDIPPGIMLCLAMGMYVVPRLPHPETKARLRAIGEYIGIVKPTPKPTPPAPPKQSGPSQASPFNKDSGRTAVPIVPL